MKNFATRFRTNQSGATAVEYGLLAGLIALAMAGVMTSVGGRLEAVFLQVAAATPVDLPAPEPET